MNFGMRKLVFFLTLFGIVFLMNCESDSTKSKDPDGFSVEVMVDASAYEWVFYSLSDSVLVTENDDWDLKFQRYRIGTNSGTSGDGKGGALDMGDLDFASVTEAPTSGYTVDDSVDIEGHSGVVTYSMNTVLAEWAEMQGMPPTFVPSEHIYAVKTHDGKYAKVQFSSYYNDESTSGYVTFKYFYQADGSSDFSGDDSEVETFTSLESPYLICASRNPGGVGFDFVWKSTTGGAQNLDENEDLKWDLKILTIKGEKSDGSLGGAPAIYLYGDSDDDSDVAKATQVGTGIDYYNNLNSVTSDMKSALSADASDFSLDDIETGTTGKPLMSALKQQYAKLAIGEKWKSAANNDEDGDEPVWVIQTREGNYVKLIVTEFPASNAETSTGYIALEWDRLD